MLASIHVGSNTWSGATVAAFVIVAGIVVALAAYLITIALLLKKVSFTLGTVIIGVRAIANQTAPVEEVVGDIAANVIAIQNALRGVLGLPMAGPRARVRPRGGTAPVPATGRVATASPSEPQARPLRAPGSRRGTGSVSMNRR